MHLRAVKIMRRSLIGLAIVVILSVAFNYLHVWYRRARLVKKVAQVLSPETLRSFEGFEYSSTPNGILRFRLKAKRLAETRQGKSYITGIEAYDFNPDGSIRNSIRSVNGVFDSEHNSAEFSGDVRISLGDQFELGTNSLHYDLGTKIGETKDDLRFISKMVSGSAKGIVFDQGKKTLELQSNVDLILKARESVSGAMEPRQFHAVADRAFCTDEMHRMIFQGHTRIDSASEALSGDSIEAVLSPDRKRLVSLVAVGNATYGSEKADGRQFMRGDRMVFDMSQSQTLEKVNVTGQATFSSNTLSETQTLSGREIDLFWDAATAKLSRIEGRGSVSFQRKSSKEQAQISGSTLVAAFIPQSNDLQSVVVQGQAGMSIEGAEDSTRNELKSDEIRLSFQQVDGRAVFTKLRAEGAAKWVSRSKPKNPALHQDPVRTLEASLLEMFFSGEGDSLESGSASVNVVISENRSAAGGEAQLSRLRADHTQFHFFPGNKLRNITANGHVQASYEKRESLKKQPGPEKFNASSDNMEAIFRLRNGESAVESAAQWGNFVYRDASMTATAGRCEYDAQKGILALKESPGISDDMSSTSGERMEYDLDQKIVAVYGRVRSRLNTKNSKGSFMALSSSSSPIIITADEMRYWTADRHAVYAGKVQLLSENGQLQAGRLDITEGGDRVEATDAVRHYIPQRAASKTEDQVDKIKEKRSMPGTEMTIQSSSLKYERQKNTITYSGHVIVRSGELNLLSDTLEATLSQSGGEIERAIARGHVQIRQNGKEGKADVADYFLKPHKFVLTGSPAEIYEQGKVRSSAPQLTYFIADDRILFGDQ